MTLNSQIYEQLTTAHRHDLLQAADRNRLAAHARRHRATSAARQPSRWARWAGLHRRSAPRPGVRASSPRRATR
jgi:hypothetical protein